ncbi:MAG: hypothetical protein ACXVQQ_02005 [Gaiellaceae bacterium]
MITTRTIPLHDLADAAVRGSEEIELVRIPVEDVPSLIDGCEDAKTPAGLLLFLRR